MNATQTTLVSLANKLVDADCDVHDDDIVRLGTQMANIIRDPHSGAMDGMEKAPIQRGHTVNMANAMFRCENVNAAENLAFAVLDLLD